MLFKPFTLGVSQLGLIGLLALAGSAQATVTCSDYSPANQGHDSAAYWAPYVRPTPTEEQMLGLTGSAPSVTHGQLLACYRLSAWNSWAYTGIDYLDKVTISRHVTANAVGTLALGSAAVFTSSVSPEVSGVRPTIVINTPTAGIPAECAPSVQLLDNGGILKSKVEAFLKRGYTVIVPDYLGLGIRGQAKHPYLEGVSTGRSVLDAILATKGLVAQPTAPLVMQGYSQGGQATAWAAHLAPTYAPSVSFKAIRAGGVMVDAMATIAKVWQTNDQGDSEGGLTQMALVGMMNSTDPSTRLTEAEVLSIVNNPADQAHLLALMEEVKNECRLALQWQNVWDSVRPYELSLSALVAKPAFQTWVMKNSLNGALATSKFGPAGTQVGSTLRTTVTAAPTWVRPSGNVAYYHSQSDEVIPYAAFEHMAKQVWGIPNNTKPKTSLNYTDVARLNQVWTTVTDAGGHGIAESHLYTTDFPSSRYMPEEWLHDSVYSGSRTDLKSDGSYRDPSVSN